MPLIPDRSFRTCEAVFPLRYLDRGGLREFTGDLLAGFNSALDERSEVHEAVAFWLTQNGTLWSDPQPYAVWFRLLSGNPLEFRGERLWYDVDDKPQLSGMVGVARIDRDRTTDNLVLRVNHVDGAGISVDPTFLYELGEKYKASDA